MNIELIKQILVIIPARSGSKGLKNKNLLPFNNGDSLLLRTVKQALRLFPEERIFVSTNSNEYRSVVEKNTSLKISQLRPESLSKDNSTNQEYINHALSIYKDIDIKWIIILQCTSPLRTDNHIKEAISLLDNLGSSVEMISSVHRSKENPLYVSRVLNDFKFLVPLNNKKYLNRQECPDVYQLNGAIFIINKNSFIKRGLDNITKVKPYFMESTYGIDIDDEDDFKYAEYILREKNDCLY